MLFAGGIGTYEQNLLKRMDFGPLGLPVHIYYRTDAEADWLREHQPAATLHPCPSWIYRPEEQIFWLRNLKGGLFWAPNYNIPFWGYEKLVVTLHDACLCMTKYVSWILNAYSRIMYAAIRQNADMAIAVSEFGRRMSQEMGHILNVPIHVTNLGVDPNWFTAASAERPYPFDYFVYVGNIKPHKNLSRLLLAYQKVRPKQKLICVGSFRNLKLRDNEALRLMKSMGDSVVFTDELQGEPLRAIVKHSDGLILPSFYETFPLCPVEAMAAGIPVLSSRIPSMTELHGDIPIYCDPNSIDDIAEGIKKLDNLRGIDRKERTDKGIDHAAQFNWDKTASETLMVLKQTLDQND